MAASPPSLGVAPRVSNGPAETATKTGLLFIADAGAQRVDIYAQIGLSQIASIGTGSDVPGALAVDREGNLYVASQNDRNVKVYAPPYTSAPFKTYRKGIIGSGATSIAISRDGTVYIASNIIVAVYPRHRVQPSQTLSIDECCVTGIDSIALDAAGNLYAAFLSSGSTLGYVGVFMNGSGPGNLLLGPFNGSQFSVAVDKRGDLLVGNNTSHLIGVYAPGQAQPWKTVTDYNSGPNAIAFDSSGNRLYVSDSPTTITTLSWPAAVTLSTEQVSGPTVGIATYPAPPF
jgi:sugar lactone lactonase YvrE